MKKGLITLISVFLVSLLVLTNVNQIHIMDFVKNDYQKLEEKKLEINTANFEGNELKINETDNENKDDRKYVEGEAIIVLKSDSNSKLKSISNLVKPTNNPIWDDLEICNEVSLKNYDNKAKSYNNIASNSIQYTRIICVKSENHTTEEIINELKDEVYHIQPNYLYKLDGITNDTLLKSQWAIENTGQNNGKEGSDINPIEANDSKEKVVAIIDSGIDYNHEDLKNSLWKDKNGKCGYDFFNDDDDPFDDVGHGTNCAGIIAAGSNNNQGITGALINNENVKLMSLKVSDEAGTIDDIAVIGALSYVLEKQQEGVDVVAVNCSFGGAMEELRPTDLAFIELADEIGKNGALIICAAGNDGQSIDSGKYYPSCLDSSYIVTVGSTDSSDDISYFSNYGKNYVDLAAPGESILTTSSEDSFYSEFYTDEELENLTFYSENFDSKSSITKDQDYFIKLYENSQEVGQIDSNKCKIELSSDVAYKGTGKSIKVTSQVTPGDIFSLGFPVKNAEKRKLYYYLFDF